MFKKFFNASAVAVVIAALTVASVGAKTEKPPKPPKEEKTAEVSHGNKPEKWFVEGTTDSELYPSEWYYQGMQHDFTNAGGHHYQYRASGEYTDQDLVNLAIHTGDWYFVYAYHTNKDGVTVSSRYRTGGTYTDTDSSGNTYTYRYWQHCANNNCKDKHWPE